MDFNFDLAPVVIPTTIGGTKYTLEELSGDGYLKYNNAHLACSIYVEGKLSGYRNLAALDSLAASLCLFDENHKPVSQQTVQTWPARIQKALAKKVWEISEDAEAPEKLALKMALALPGAPVTYEQIVKWLANLAPTNGNYSVLTNWFNDKDVEQLVKNG
jgi:hypothetical protein